MTVGGAIMIRQENDRLPSAEHDPQREVVSLKRTERTGLPTAAACF